MKGSYRISRTSCCKALRFRGVWFRAPGHAGQLVSAPCGLGQRKLFPEPGGQSPEEEMRPVSPPTCFLMPFLHLPHTLVEPIWDTGDSQMNAVVLDPQVLLAHNYILTYYIP